MKIAVILVGHLRAYDQTAPLLIKNLLSQYDCDLFITTYNKRYNIKKKYREGRAQNPELVDPEKVKEVYGSYLKQINVVDEDEFQYIFNKKPNKTYYESDLMLNRIKTMLKLINYAGTAMKNNKYDLIIRTRPDFMMKQPLKIDQLNWNDDAVYLFKDDPKFPISDYFMIGSSRIMKIVLDFSEEWEDLKDENYSRIEMGWINFFKQKNIKWHLIKDVCFEIIRK